MSAPAPETAVHEAIRGMLGEGEIAVCWVLTIDVAGPEGLRYLAHRSGGGADGTDHPVLWAALGMIESAAGVVHDQLSECAVDAGGDEDEPD